MRLGSHPERVYLRKKCRNKLYNLICRVLTAASVKMTAVWDIASCSLVEVDRRFRGTYCLHRQGDDCVDSPDDEGSRYF
jgi:hypothetical protein